MYDCDCWKCMGYELRRNPLEMLCNQCGNYYDASFDKDGICFDCYPFSLNWKSIYTDFLQRAGLEEEDLLEESDVWDEETFDKWRSIKKRKFWREPSAYVTKEHMEEMQSISKRIGVPLQYRQGARITRRGEDKDQIVIGRICACGGHKSALAKQCMDCQIQKTKNAVAQARICACGGRKSVAAKQCMNCVKVERQKAKDLIDQSRICRCGGRKSAAAKQCINCVKLAGAEAQVAARNALSQRSNQWLASRSFVVANRDRVFSELSEEVHLVLTSGSDKDLFLDKKIRNELHELAKDYEEMKILSQSTATWSSEVIKAAREEYFDVMGKMRNLKELRLLISPRARSKQKYLDEQRKINMDFYSNFETSGILGITQETLDLYVREGHIHRCERGFHKQEIQDFMDHRTH